MSFAKGTVVSVEKSRAEIETTLRRYGATAFISGYEGPCALLGFEAKGRRLRFILPMPQATDKNLRHNGRGRLLSPTDIDKNVKAEERRRFRALCLVIKAKLEAVESGIETFENAFLANIVVPGTSTTIGDWAAPQIARAYDEGMSMPPLLGA